MSSSACPVCGVINRGSQPTCLGCGASLAAEPAPRAAVPRAAQPAAASAQPPAPPPPPPAVQPAQASAPVPAAFVPTHIVPATGLQTRARPDPAMPLGPPLPPYLEVQVVATSGDWAEIRCSNEWLAWVDARHLIQRTV